MKTITFSKDIIYDLLKDGICTTNDNDYRNFQINVVTSRSSEILFDEINYELNIINISKYDVIDLLQKNFITIYSTTILLY